MEGWVSDWTRGARLRDCIRLSCVESLPRDKIRSSQAVLLHTLHCSLGFGIMTWSEQKNTDTEEVHSLQQRYLSADVSLIECQQQTTGFRRSKKNLLSLQQKVWDNVKERRWEKKQEEERKHQTKSNQTHNDAVFKNVLAHHGTPRDKII